MKMSRWGIGLGLVGLVVGWFWYQQGRVDEVAPPTLPIGVPIPQGDAMIVRYGQDYRQQFEAYVPKVSQNTLLVLIHGGSWVAGDKSQLAEIAAYVVKRGVTAVTINYRLAPQWHYKAMIEDVASAIKLIEQTPEAYGLDNEYRLAVMGYSAGAHLAASFCVSESALGIREAASCIGLAGIYDVERIMHGKDGPLLMPVAAAMLGDDPAQQASPVSLVSSGEQTQFLLIWGEDDDVVSAAQMTDFKQALLEAGAEVKAVVAPLKNHQSIFSTIPDDDELAQLMWPYLLP